MKFPPCLFSHYRKQDGLIWPHPSTHLVSCSGTSRSWSSSFASSHWSLRTSTKGGFGWVFLGLWLMVVLCDLCGWWRFWIVFECFQEGYGQSSEQTPFQGHSSGGRQLFGVVKKGLWEWLMDGMTVFFFPLDLQSDMALMDSWTEDSVHRLQGSKISGTSSRQVPWESPYVYIMYIYI